MSSGINLLSSDQKISAKIGARRLTILRTTAVWLLFGISAMSIVLILLIALSPLPTVQKQEQNALTSLSEYHPEVAKLLLVKDRLKGSEEIIAKRSRFDLALEKIKNKMPPATRLTGLTMNEKEISVTVTSTSLDALDTFLESMISATEAKEDFSKVTMTNFLSNVNTGTYSLTIEVVAL